MMISFTNLLESLEKLAFDMLLWIIFIPKTLIKVFWNPFWVPNYIETELNKKDERFSDYISPILLFTLIVVSLITFNKGVLRINIAAISGETTAQVNETSVFFAQPNYSLGSLLGYYYCAEIWDIYAENFTLIHRFIRVNKSCSSKMDIITFIEIKSDVTKNTELKVETLKNLFEKQTYPSKFTYTWRDSGEYRTTVTYYNFFGEISSAEKAIYVSSKDKTILPPPDLNQNFFSENKELTKFLLALSDPTESDTTSFSTLLAFLIIPFFLSIISLTIQGGTLTRQELRYHFYVHTLYISPLVTTYLFYQIAHSYSTTVFDPSWLGVLSLNGKWVPGLARAYTGVYQIHETLSKGFYFISLLWFVFVDVKFSLRKIDINPIITILITILCVFLVSLVSRIIKPLAVLFDPFNLNWGVSHLLFKVYFLSIILPPIYILAYKSTPHLIQILTILYKGFLSKRIVISMFRKK